MSSLCDGNDLLHLNKNSASGVDTDSVAVFVMEGDAVTLYTDVKANQQDRLKWYFNDTRIAQINGDQRKICTDVQCEKRFRDRLKLDHQTGSLTIINIKTTDSELYELQFNNGIIEKIYYVSVHGASGVDTDGVSLFVMEGDSVTLHTDISKTQQERIKWYFNDACVAEMNGDFSQICANDKCHNDEERFRDGMKLDHQTGSLTITNIRTTDSGLYKLQIINNSSSISEKIFSVTVRDVPGAETHKMKTMPVVEGESVTLDPGVIKKTNDLMTWYFNDICIAEVSGDFSKICTDVQCNEGTERFRDRLKLDHQTGSLTIMNIRNTDTGLYKLEINSTNSSIRRRRSNSISISSFKSFSVAVIESGQSVAGICACVGIFLLVSVAVSAGVIHCRCNNSTQPEQNEHHVEHSSPNMAEMPLMTVANESSPNQTEAASVTST
ncbi:uncharacterized protein [Sinocyclocheilus grahami]|uniref:uncharacterized protein n=1 Tax=Sinocyclocheilus grahami TaxID=75366 RepID=UPI0007ACA370|nr:PREDICTED: uncharacterized protein LOC107571329 [Sinocyclocheilus grahami]